MEQFLYEFMRDINLESAFYIECLGNQIKRLDKRGRQLQNDIKLITALGKVKNVKSEEEFLMGVQDFLDSCVVGKLKFKNVVDLKWVKGKPVVKYIKPEYFAKIDSSDKEDRQRLDENIKQKILIGLMINFETLFTKVISYLMPKRHENFFSNSGEGNGIPVLEILNNPEKDFKQYVIDMQVEKLCYDIIGTIESLVQRLNLQKFYFEKHGKLVEEFYEVYYRRNLIIHNNSIVNRLYLKKLKKDESYLKIGTKLELSDEYIENSKEICLKFGCLMYAMLGKMLEDKDKEEYYAYINSYAFALLKQKNWSLGLFMCELLQEFSCTNNEERLVCAMNTLNCKKHVKDATYKKLAEELDVSACRPIYVVGKELLLNNNKNVYTLLKEFYPAQISKNEIQTWPIFYDFKETEEFKKFNE